MQPKKKVVEGVINRGLGEGAFFMSINHYKKEIKKKLGFEAYPGTLNIKVKKSCLILLEKTGKTRINGFETSDRKFGGAVCYKGRINGIKGSILVPDVNKHGKDIIEFIAPVHIKSELNLKDGDKIQIELE